MGKHSAPLRSSLKYNFGFPKWFLDDDLEGYDRMVSGRRKTGRVSHLLVVTCNPVLVFDVANH